MKKTYLKPEAEYVSLLPENILTYGVGDFDGDMGSVVTPDDWV